MNFLRRQAELVSLYGLHMHVHMVLKTETIERKNRTSEDHMLSLSSFGRWFNHEDILIRLKLRRWQRVRPLRDKNITAQY